MPNDMSPLETVDTTARLSSQTARYCTRADALTRDPALTMTDAARALDHLAVLQGDLTSERHRKSLPLRSDLRRIEAPFKHLEHRLETARAELSSALLRAKPTESDRYGLVPHVPDPVGKIKKDPDVGRHDTTRPVSACRSLLDLEALRPYFSDEALRQAIENHSKATTTHAVQGVAYATLPQSAHLPCDIY